MATAHPMTIVSIAQRLARELVDLEREVGSENYSPLVKNYLTIAVHELDSVVTFLKAANIACAAERLLENKNAN